MARTVSKAGDRAPNGRRAPTLPLRDAALKAVQAHAKGASANELIDYIAREFGLTVRPNHPKTTMANKAHQLNVCKRPSVMMKSTMKIAILLGLSLVLATAWSAISHAKTSFVVLGDTGTGDCNQYKVARALTNWWYGRPPVKEHHIDFVLLAGDNFYDRGLRHFCSEEQQLPPDEPRSFQRAFLDPYGPAARLTKGANDPVKNGTALCSNILTPRSEGHNLVLPFYPILGNHDYSAVCSAPRDTLSDAWCGKLYNGALGVGADPFNLIVGGYQYYGDDCFLESTINEHGPRWELKSWPPYYLVRDTADLVLLGVDTTPMVSERLEIFSEDGDKYVPDTRRLHEYVEQQADGFLQTLQYTTANWKIVFGHHPFVSNGDHGTAGRYDVHWEVDMKSFVGDCLSVNSAADMPVLNNGKIIGGGWHCGWRLRQFFVGGAPRAGDSTADPIPGLCEAGLDVYFSGHDHLLQVSSAECAGRSIPFIVSGGGGRGLNPIPVRNKPQEPQSWLWKAFFGHFGFVYVEIRDPDPKGEFQMDLTVVGADDPEKPGELLNCSVFKKSRIGPSTITCEQSGRPVSLTKDG
jgi:hypothetical protein